MPRLIKLESVAQETPLEILQVDAGTLTIGREPENHVVVDSDSVSRQHGCILEADGHWLYRDFQSTNGSWINGVQLTPGQLRLLRDGDVIQLADFPMRIGYLDQAQDETPLLIVFSENRFLGTFYFQSNDDLFAVGGPKGTYFIDEASKHQAQLQIGRNGSRLELTAGVTEYPVVVNGMASTGVTTLSDRDEVSVGPFQIIVSDLSSAMAAGAQSQRAGIGSSPMYSDAQAYDRPNVPEHMRRPETEDWESEAARRRTTDGRRFVFGTDPDENEVTSTLGVTRLNYTGTSGFEMSASQRFSRAVADAENEGTSPVKEGVLIIFGIFVFCLILGLIGYFLLVMT